MQATAEIKQKLQGCIQENWPDIAHLFEYEETDIPHVIATYWRSVYDKTLGNNFKLIIEIEYYGDVQHLYTRVLFLKGKERVNLYGLKNRGFEEWDETIAKTRNFMWLLNDLVHPTL